MQHERGFLVAGRPYAVALTVIPRMATRTLVALLLLACLSTSQAQLRSESMNVSGVIRHALGDPVTTPVNLRFVVYDSMAAGALLRTEL